MTTYIDSSVLVAVYVPERFSTAARRAVRGAPQVPFTQLHELEISNAFELLVGRGLISREECRVVQAQLDEDIETQRLTRLSLDLDTVFTNAAELSRAHTARALTQPRPASRSCRAGRDVHGVRVRGRSPAGGREGAGPGGPGHQASRPASVSG